MNQIRTFYITNLQQDRDEIALEARTGTWLISELSRALPTLPGILEILEPKNTTLSLDKWWFDVRNMANSQFYCRNFDQALSDDSIELI